MARSGLTLKQEAFCAAYIELGDATEAYVRAYDAARMHRHVIKVKACELLKHPGVAARVEEMQAGLRGRHEVTVDRIVAELAKIAFVDADKDETTVIQNKLSALDKLGKHFGMFTAKVEHTGKDGAPLLPERTATPRELARVFVEIIREANLQGPDENDADAAAPNKDDPQ